MFYDGINLQSKNKITIKMLIFRICKKAQNVFTKLTSISWFR